jgi:hypothetical protein
MIGEPPPGGAAAGSAAALPSGTLVDPPTPHPANITTVATKGGQLRRFQAAPRGDKSRCRIVRTCVHMSDLLTSAPRNPRLSAYDPAGSKSSRSMEKLALGCLPELPRSRRGGCRPLTTGAWRVWSYPSEPAEMMCLPTRSRRLRHDGRSRTSPHGPLLFGDFATHNCGSTAVLPLQVTRHRRPERRPASPPIAGEGFHVG